MNKHSYHSHSIHYQIWIIHHDKDLGFSIVPSSYYWLLLPVKMKNPSSDLSWAAVCAELSSFQTQMAASWFTLATVFIELAIAKFKLAQLIN